jgi:hypothetical protein
MFVRVSMRALACQRERLKYRSVQVGSIEISTCSRVNTYAVSRQEGVKVGRLAGVGVVCVRA